MFLPWDQEQGENVHSSGHCTTCSGQSTMQGNQKQVWEKEKVRFVFIDDIIVHIENPKECFKNLVALIKNLAHSQKSVVFLYISNKH